MRALEEQTLGGRAVECGIISPDELARAKSVATEQGLSLGDALIETGIATEDQIVALRAAELGIPAVFPYANTLDSRALTPFSEQVLRRFDALPISREEDHVVVALAEVASPATRHALEDAAGMPVTFALAGRHRIRNILADRFGPETSRRAGPEGSGAVGAVYVHLARALDEGATELRFDHDERGIVVRYRIGGRSVERGREHASEQLALCARLRVLVGAPQEPDGATPFATTGSVRTRIGATNVVLDLSVLAGAGGVSCRLGIIRLDSPVSLETLGLGGSSVAALRRVGSFGHGLVLVAADTSRHARRLAYAIACSMDDGRSITCVASRLLEHEPRFTQLVAPDRLPRALRAAIRHAPDVLIVEDEVAWDRAEELDAIVRAASERLVLLLCTGKTSAALVDLAVRARSGLARVLSALIDVDDGGVSVREPGPELRGALEERASPRRIRDLVKGC